MCSGSYRSPRPPISSIMGGATHGRSRHGPRACGACATIAAMPWSQLDTAAVARALSQIAEQPEDLVDAYFERREEVELPPEEDAPGLRVWRGGGVPARLPRGPPPRPAHRAA